MAKAKEPRPASHFKLVIGGHESAGIFREVSGLSSETDVVEYKYADQQGKPSIRRVTGINKVGDIKLSRGVDNNLELWKWRQQVIDGGPDAARVDGQIMLLDYDGSPISTWKFLQGWPKKYDGGTFNASSNEVSIESVEICTEGIFRT